jgi:hypothetical protein
MKNLALDTDASLCTLRKSTLDKEVEKLSLKELNEFKNILSDGTAYADKLISSFE